MSSFERLTPTMQQLVIDCADLCVVFNVGQLLQGENLPSDLNNLETALKASTSNSNTPLRFFIFTVTCIISGVLGHVSMKGSVYLNEDRGWPLLMALETLRDESGDPVERYWSFIRRRVSLFGVRVEGTVEDRVLARLACISRVTRVSEMAYLREYWYSMTRNERCYVCSRLGSNGISEQAFLLQYLPQFFTAARANDCLTLSDTFHVLIDFY